MVNRIVVGAHYGLRDWLAQRITAVVMALYTLIMTAYLLPQPLAGFEQWKAAFSPQWVRVLTLLCLLCLFFHAWIGVRDILMDYIKQAGIRLTLHVMTILALAGYAIWAIAILWGL